MQSLAKTKSGCNFNLRNGRFKGIKRYLPFYVMFLPVFLYYIIFHYFPMCGIVMAFQDYNFLDGILHSPWVGLKHFQRFVSNGDFWMTTKNTLLISGLRIIFGFPAPIIFALLLNEVRHQKYKKLIQTVSYLPHFISWVIVYGILYNVFSVNGLVNQIGALFGKDPIAFLGRSEYFRGIYVLSAMWKELGWSAIIYLSALTAIDVQLYEAAMVDGAGRWRMLWHITLPGIRVTVCTMCILAFGKVMSTGFEQILVMYNSSVSQVAEVLDYYIYRTGLLQANNYSYATAVGLFKGVVALILVASTNLVARKVEEDGALW